MMAAVVVTSITCMNRLRQHCGNEILVCLYNFVCFLKLELKHDEWAVGD